MSVVKLKLKQTLDDAVREIHRQFAEAESSEKKSHRCRLRVGYLLHALKKRVEAGEEGVNASWWDWYESKFVRSRRDASRCMALVKADDPEIAAEEERARNREAQRRHRTLTDVSQGNDDELQPDDEEEDEEPFTPLPAPDLVDKALELVHRMNSYQRRRFFAALKEAYREDIETDD